MEENKILVLYIKHGETLSVVCFCLNLRFFVKLQCQNSCILQQRFGIAHFFFFAALPIDFCRKVISVPLVTTLKRHINAKTD